MAFEKIKSLFNSDDEYYEDDYENDYSETPHNQSQSDSHQYFNRPQTSVRQSNVHGVAASSGNKIALFEPKVYSDSRAISSQILNGEAVIVNFTQIDEDQAKRILDFLGGVVFAVSGEIERIGQSIFLVTPNTFEISGTLTDNLEPNSRY